MSAPAGTAADVPREAKSGMKFVYVSKAQEALKAALAGDGPGR